MLTKARKKEQDTIPYMDDPCGDDPSLIPLDITVPVNKSNIFSRNPKFLMVLHIVLAGLIILSKALTIAYTDKERIAEIFLFLIFASLVILLFLYCITEIIKSIFDATIMDKVYDKTGIMSGAFLSDVIYPKEEDRPSNLPLQSFFVSEISPGLINKFSAVDQNLAKYKIDQYISYNNFRYEIRQVITPVK